MKKKFQDFFIDFYCRDFLFAKCVFQKKDEKVGRCRAVHIGR